MVIVMVVKVLERVIRRSPQGMFDGGRHGARMSSASAVWFSPNGPTTNGCATCFLLLFPPLPHLLLLFLFFFSISFRTRLFLRLLRKAKIVWKHVGAQKEEEEVGYVVSFIDPEHKSTTKVLPRQKIRTTQEMKVSPFRLFLFLFLVLLLFSSLPPSFHPPLPLPSHSSFSLWWIPK